MKTKKVAVYRDPLGGRLWIVSTHCGDQSEELVLSSHPSRRAAVRAARVAARRIGCPWGEEECALR